MLKYKINLDTENVVDNHISIKIGQLFYPNSEQYEVIENKFDISNLNVINPTIDFEKVRLHPIISSNINNDIQSITFKLHFYISNNWTYNSTLLSDIGYTSDDVINRRKRLSNNFIRLSFYDSNDIKVQNLLYYSTIFINSGDLYDKYINNGLSMSTLMTDFTIYNPRTSLKIASFEGFYIYLFGSDILKNTITTIYMKVEYNSALNGKTSLFLKDYSHGSVNGFNLSDLKSNMFIPINIEYNTNLNKYVYWFNDYNTENTVINLYQAKVK